MTDETNWERGNNQKNVKKKTIKNIPRVGLVIIYRYRVVCLLFFQSCARASCLKTVSLRARLCNSSDVLAGGGARGAGGEGRARAPTLFDNNHPAFYYQPWNLSGRVLLVIASIAIFFLASR